MAPFGILDDSACLGNVALNALDAPNVSAESLIC
ncbi:MAG: hypothetical protein HW392_1508, partial [Steroidobacteraceae bacterium]|nr:hypothetical protein [Steroidobacteraceae bacterium]